MVYVVDRDAELLEMLDETDSLLLERLLSQYDLGIMRAQRMTTLEDAFAAMYLLRMLQMITDKQNARIKDRSLRKVQPDTPITHVPLNDL